MKSLASMLVLAFALCASAQITNPFTVRSTVVMLPATYAGETYNAMQFDPKSDGRLILWPRIAVEGGGGGTITGGITSLNGSTNASQSFATGVGGSDFNIASLSGLHTFNLPTAGPSIRGALSSADWSAFNLKASTTYADTVASNRVVVAPGVNTTVGVSGADGVTTFTVNSAGVSDGDKGDITVSASGATYTINDNKVTNAKLRDSLSFSVIGRPGNATGDPQDIRVSGAGGPELLMLDIDAFAVRWASFGTEPSLIGNNGLNLDPIIAVPPLVLYAAGPELTFDQTATLDNNARVTARKNSGVDVGTRRRLNFIEGGNVTLTVADDAANEELTVTIAATGGGGGGTAVAVTGSARGLVTENNPTTPDSKVDVRADEAVLRDGAGASFLAQAVNVTVDIAAATGANALDTGAEASSTWYYVWLIYNGTTVAGLLSTSATAPTMPAGYTYKARMGAVRNDGSANFVRFVGLDRHHFIDQQVIFTARTATAANTFQILAGTDLTAFRAAVPPIAKTVSGTAGSNAAASANTVAACNSDGTANSSSIGTAQQTIPTLASAYDSFFSSSQFMSPVRGGANYNIQWKCLNTSAQNRLVVSGFTLN